MGDFFRASLKLPMTDSTLRSRLLCLAQESRRAVRLYASAAGSSTTNRNNEPQNYKEIQATEWRMVNEELIKFLGEALSRNSQKNLTRDVTAIRNSFHAEFRYTISKLADLHNELLCALETADYPRCAKLSVKLTALKAHERACQAVVHELQRALGGSSKALRNIEDTESLVGSGQEHEACSQVELTLTLEQKEYPDSEERDSSPQTINKMLGRRVEHLSKIVDGKYTGIASDGAESISVPSPINTVQRGQGFQPSSPPSTMNPNTMNPNNVNPNNVSMINTKDKCERAKEFFSENSTSKTAKILQLPKQNRA